MKLDLLTKEVEDQIARENFVRIKRELEAQQILRGQWRFFETEFTQTGVKVPVKHNLSFVPRDIIILSAEGDRNFYFNYENFDDKNLYVTISKPVRLRYLAGRYTDPGYKESKKDFAFVSPPQGGEPTWYTGAGNPTVGLGTAGDFFLNTNSKEVFLKVSNAWVTQGFLQSTIASTDKQLLDVVPITVLANAWTSIPLVKVNKVADVQVFNAAYTDKVDIEWRLVSAGAGVEIRSKKANTYTVHVEGYKI